MGLLSPFEIKFSIQIGAGTAKPQPKGSTTEGTEITEKNNSAK